MQTVTGADELQRPKTTRIPPGNIYKVAATLGNRLQNICNTCEPLGRELECLEVSGNWLYPHWRCSIEWAEQLVLSLACLGGPYSLFFGVELALRSFFRARSMVCSQGTTTKSRGDVCSGVRWAAPEKSPDAGNSCSTARRIDIQE